MKVIGAGFARTGTLSLKHALEQLGFDPCYHMETVMMTRNHIDMWQEVADGDEAVLAKVVAGYPAGVDFPISSYYQELMAIFPEAKVLLSVRDPERWYDSVNETIYNAQYLPKPLMWFVPRMQRFVKMVDATAWQRMLHGKFEDRAYAIQRFNDHIEEVKATVPAEKLLVFNVKEGWEPLCTFLEVPVPDTPFPHKNDRKRMLRRFQMMRWMAWGLTGGVLAIVALLLNWMYQFFLAL